MVRYSNIIILSCKFSVDLVFNGMNIIKIIVLIIIIVVVAFVIKNKIIKIISSTQ